jgi:phosphatidylserine/phosphatidylglycerophosphate/cardiolipin synthase-like enzyme
MARKILLLQDTQSEVLVLTSSRFTQSWSAELRSAVERCARRGLRVRVLVEDGGPVALAGVEQRRVPRSLAQLFRAPTLHSEIWIFDHDVAITANERPGESAPLECLLGAASARGLATYLERRWENGGRPLAYSVRHQGAAFVAGERAEREFFHCLLRAQKEIVLSLPGGRVSRRVERALHAALREGIRVVLFTNADRDDAPGLRRLARLAHAGAALKLCGRRLRSEAAVIDRRGVYLGCFPTSMHRLLRSPAGPVFVAHDTPAANDLLEALDSQVSVDIGGSLEFVASPS